MAKLSQLDIPAIYAPAIDNYIAADTGLASQRLYLKGLATRMNGLLLRRATYADQIKRQVPGIATNRQNIYALDFELGTLSGRIEESARDLATLLGIPTPIKPLVLDPIPNTEEPAYRLIQDGVKGSKITDVGPKPVGQTTPDDVRYGTNPNNGRQLSPPGTATAQPPRTADQPDWYRGAADRLARNLPAQSQEEAVWRMQAQRQ